MRKSITIIILTMVCLPLAPALGQNERMTLSITPPLASNNVVPGQVFKASLKVVNNNKEEVSVYTRVSDFLGGSEHGQISFIETEGMSEEEKAALASNWIVIDPGPHIIAPNQSKEVEYIVNVPDEATPGGHYAAILVGTNPEDGPKEGSSIRISSLLTSILLFSVKGDVVEEGRIREFSVSKTVYKEPKVDFTLRFENTGNVHVQPQGEIRIYDWFDNQKEVITINHGTQFGNVLPNNVRKWNFSWEGEKGLAQMGRYRADMILGFGQNGRQTVNRSLYFWVLDFKVLGITAASVLGFILLVFLFIKFYIRRAIIKTQRALGISHSTVPVGGNKKVSVIPKENGNDAEETTIKKKVQKTPEPSGRLNFILLFTLLALVAALSGTGIAYLAHRNSQESRPAVQSPVTASTVGEREADKEPKPPIENNLMVIDPEPESPDSVATSSLEQAATSTPDMPEEEIEEVVEIRKDIRIRVLNGSGQAGQAGRMARILEEDGFAAGEMGNADTYDHQSTKLQYLSEYEVEAAYLEELIGLEVERSVLPAGSDWDAVIITGKDFE